MSLTSVSHVSRGSLFMKRGLYNLCDRNLSSHPRREQKASRERARAIEEKRESEGEIEVETRGGSP